MQARHLKVMLRWWKSRGALAHLLQSNCPLNPGRGALTKVQCTATPRVSILVFLLRKYQTKGKYHIPSALRNCFVVVFFKCNTQQIFIHFIVLGVSQLGISEIFLFEIILRKVQIKILAHPVPSVTSFLIFTTLLVQHHFWGK